VCLVSPRRVWRRSKVPVRRTFRHRRWIADRRRLESARCGSRRHIVKYLHEEGGIHRVYATGIRRPPGSGGPAGNQHRAGYGLPCPTRKLCSALRFREQERFDAVVLSELDQYLLIIEKTLYQVPQVLTSYQDVISSHLVPKASQSFTVNEPGKENLRSSLEELRTHLDSYRAQYPVVRDFLRVAPQTRAIITQWQLPPLHGDVRTQ
jgi:hypothetical protein